MRWIRRIPQRNLRVLELVRNAHQNRVRRAQNRAPEEVKSRFTRLVNGEIHPNGQQSQADANQSRESYTKSNCLRPPCAADSSFDLSLWLRDIFHSSMTVRVFAGFSCGVRI